MRAYRPNEDQTWRDVYSREYGAAEGRGLQSWQAREEASRTAWRDYEARTGKPALMRNGSEDDSEPYRRIGHKPNAGHASAQRDAWNEDVRRALESAGHGNRPFSMRELTERLQGRISSNDVRYQVSRLARTGYVTFGDSGMIGITNLGWNWIEGAPPHASNASGYYVWALARGSNAPLAEGPWGPYATLESAKTFARIGATEGAHDRAVSTGLDPKAPSFQIVRRYEAGTGERLL